MKIYFTGSHGSGKTTLSRYVSEKYSLPLISEVARMVLSEKELQVDLLRTNIDLVDQYQSSVFNRQIEEEKRYQSFVSDRCLLDCIAYCAQHASVAHQLISDKSFNDYLRSFKHNSTVFFVRPSKATLKTDGVRENLNWDGAVQIDSMIKLLLEINSIKYF